MGFLLLERTADREVNSSWPGEARRGRWGVIDACTGIHLGPNSISRPLCHSLTISEDYLSLFFHLILLLDNLVDLDNKVPLSIHREAGSKEDFRLTSFWFLSADAA